MDWEGIGSTTWGAAQFSQASISVLLIMAYGYLSRSYELMTHQGEKNVSKLVSILCLPALLFSGIGPTATASTLGEYWAIIVFSLVTQLFSLLYAYFGRQLLGISSAWLFPACIFNNTITLPLLMLDSLASTSALDGILGTSDAEAALRRAKTYFLVNALVSHLMSSGFAPRLMQSHSNHVPRCASPAPSVSRSVDSERSEGERVPLLAGSQPQSSFQFRLVWRKIISILNPPLIGGLLAIVVGIIPPLHFVFLDKGGVFRGSFTQSVDKIGGLYTALQMLVVGAQLCSSSQRSGVARMPKLALIFLFALRFVLMPIFSISFIYGVRLWKPDLLLKDPMFDLALMVAPVGPPAINLAALAEIANISEDEQGALARVLTLSYAVTPFISIPIAAALTVVKKEGLIFES